MWGQLSKITQYTRDVLVDQLASGEEEETDSEVDSYEESQQIASPVDVPDEREILSLKKDRARLQKQLNEAETKNMTIIREFNLLMQEKEAELVSMNKKVQEEKSKNEKATADLQKTNQNLQEQVKFLQNKLIESVEKIEEPENSVQSASESDRGESSDLPVSDGEIEKLRKQSIQAQRKNEEIISALQSQLARDEEVITSLKTKKEDERVRTKEQYEQEFQQLKDKLIQVHAKNEDMILELNQQITDDAETIALLKVQVEEEKLRADEACAQKQALTPNFTSTKTELENLQSYMEQIQTDHQKDIELRTFQLKQQVSKLTKQLQDEQDKITEMNQCKDQNLVLQEELQQLKMEFKTQAIELQRLREDHEPLNQAFQRTLSRLNESLDNSQNLVDKRIVTKLFLTYHNDVAQRQAVLAVMSGVLNFSVEEQKAVGLIVDTTTLSVAGTTLGWLKNWWGRSSVPVAQALMKQSEKHVKSLSELWVEFLLHEAQATLEENPAATIENKQNTEAPNETQTEATTPLSPADPTEGENPNNYTVVAAITPASTPVKPKKSVNTDSDKTP